MGYFFLPAREVEGECLLDDFFAHFWHEFLPDVIKRSLDDLIVDDPVVMLDRRRLDENQVRFD